jgi:hypothetical protein
VVTAPSDSRGLGVGNGVNRGVNKDVVIAHTVHFNKMYSLAHYDVLYIRPANIVIIHEKIVIIHENVVSLPRFNEQYSP